MGAGTLRLPLTNQPECRLGLARGPEVLLSGTLPHYKPRSARMTPTPEYKRAEILASVTSYFYTWRIEHQSSTGQASPEQTTKTKRPS